MKHIFTLVSQQVVPLGFHYVFNGWDALSELACLAAP